MSHSVRWFALGFALVGCATHSGDDQPVPGDTAHLEVVIDTPTLRWADGVADTSSVHAIRVDDTDGTRTDVTDQAAFTVSPVELGAVAATTLAPSGQMAGEGQLTAAVSTLIGMSNFTVYVSDTVPGTADPTAATLFAGATLDQGATIAVAYPPAGALIPPNIGEMDVHWRDATKDLYEVQLSGTFVTLKTYVNTLGAATWTTLADDRWQQLSQGSSGLDLEVRVRGLTMASPATFIEGKETVRVAAEQVKGGVYYWNTTKAAIMRFDMSTPAVPAEQFYPQVGQSGCVGCHAVSRDGTVVAYRQEGGNLNYGNALDVASLSRKLTDNTQQWNFATIAPDNSEMFTTTQNGLYRTDLATQATTPLFTTTRISHPDIAASGNAIVATQMLGGSEVWTSAGQIVVFDYDNVGKTVGAPRTLAAPSGGAYQYYPSFSPDNEWVIYNQATGGTSYNNPNAEMWVTKADGSLGAPIRLTSAEVAGTYDSWPKWTPFITNEPTMTSSEPVIWFTVASQRPFGVRSVGAQKPQLWLAPFFPERALAGQPATGPAIRLPFQALAEGNHIAQWTEAIVTLQ
jgi:mono/diheme cytochrome c family protein